MLGPPPPPSSFLFTFQWPSSPFLNECTFWMTPSLGVKHSNLNVLTICWRCCTGKAELNISNWIIAIAWNHRSMINIFEKLNRWNSFHKNVYILLWLIWTMQSIFMRKAAKSTHFVLLGHTLQCSVVFLVNILTFCSEYFNWFIFSLIWRVQLFYLAWSWNKFGFLI